MPVRWEQQKENAHKETPAASAAMRMNVGKSTRSSSPAPKPQTKSDGKNSPKENSLRGRSPSGKRSRRPCKDCIRGKCTNPSRDYRHPPVCQNHKTESGCRFVEKCAFMHGEVDRQPCKRPNNGEGSVALLKKFLAINLVAYSRTSSRRNPIRFYEREKSLGPKRSVRFSEGTSRHVKIRERKGPSQGVCQHTGSQQRSSPCSEIGGQV